MNYALAYPRFWLWYFVGSVGLALVSSIYSVARAFGGTGSSSVLGVALGWASLWPLYGYARQVRVNPRWLWLTIFIVSALAVGLVVLAVLFVAVSRATVLPILYLVPAIALAGPSVFALHQYVYRSPHIWVAA
jgi:hypothetical protein